MRPCKEKIDCDGNGRKLLYYTLLYVYEIVGISGDKYASYKQCNQRSILMAVTAAGAGKGGGLLEKPTIERNTPGRESEFDLRYSRYTLYFIWTNF